MPEFKTYKVLTVKDLITVLSKLDKSAPITGVNGTLITNGVLISKDRAGYMIQFVSE